MNEFDTTTVSEGLTVSEIKGVPTTITGLDDGAMVTSGMLDSDGLPKISSENFNMHEYRRFNDTLHAIWGVCKAAGFRLEGRVTLVDKRTGRVWK